MKKSVLFPTLVAVTLLSTPAFATDSISVTLDGKEIVFDTQPIIKSDRLLVPMRTIFESLGARVDWEDDTKTVTATKNAEYCSITIGSDILYTGIRSKGDDYGECIGTDATYLEAPALIENGRTLVPLRAVSEALKADVQWDNESKTCTIDIPNEANDWMFYASWSDGGRLYKIDSNGNNRQKLSDMDCYDIFLYNDTVYFQTRETNGALFSVGLNGENHKQLTDEPIEVKSINDGKIYYVVSETQGRIPALGPLYSMNLDGTDKKFICDEHVSSVVVAGERIFYHAYDNFFNSYPGKMYRINADGTEKTLITRDEFAPVLTYNSPVIDSYLYIRDSKSDRRARINTETLETEILGDRIVDYKTIDNHIIFRKGLQSGELYISDLDGKNEKRLAEDVSLYRFSYGDNIYYNKDADEDPTEWIYQLWKCDKDGNNEKYLLTGYIIAENYEDRIYYSSHYEFTDEGARFDGVYSVDMDGENPYTVTEDTVEGYLQTNGYVYITTPNKRKIYRYNQDGTGKKLITNENTNYEVYLSTGISRSNRISFDEDRY